MPSTHQSAALHTLDKGFLAEDIDDQQREDYQQHRRLAGSVCIDHVLQTDLHILDHGVCQGLGVRIKRIGIDDVRPLPSEGEEKNRHHHGPCIGQHDEEKSAENPVTVHIGGLLQFNGHSSEKLPQHVDIQAVLDPLAGHRKYDKRYLRIQQVEPAQKETKLEIERRQDQLGGHQKGENYKAEENGGKFGLKPGEAIGHHSAENGLQHPGDQGQLDAVGQGGGDFQHLQRPAVKLQ